MAVARDCRYLPTHEWFRVEGSIVTIGITQFAADALTDVTYVSLPAAGKAVSAGASFGEVESVKATSDVYSAFSGVVAETNARLEAEPNLVNDDPQGAGWMIKINAADLTPLSRLMDADAYEKMIKG